jgi:hypothetical protein
MKKSLLSIVVVIAMTLALTACSIGGVNFNVNSQMIKGSGTVTSEERTVSNFSKVELKSIGNLTIKQGANESLTIKADDNLLPYITSEVVNGTLEIGMKPNINADPTSTIEYTLVVKSLSSVVLSGFGNISADELTGDDIQMVVSGSGDINVGSVAAKRMTLRLTGFGNIKTGDVKADSSVLDLTGSGDITINKLASTDLNLTISGFGNATIAGKVSDQVVRLTGSGSYHGDDLQSDSTNITISGFGNANIWAEKTLDLSITGSGNVEYYGDPTLNQSITGLGKVKSMGSH